MRTSKLILLFCLVFLCFSLSLRAQENKQSVSGTTALNKTQSIDGTVFGQTHLFQVKFFNESKGVIIGGQTTNAFITSDKGSYWSTVSAFPNTMIQGLYVEKGTGNALAVGQWNTVRRTTDYGNSWTTETITWDNVNPVHFKSVDVNSAGVGLAVGDGGKIYRKISLFTKLDKLLPESRIKVQTVVNQEINVQTDIEIKSLKVINLSGKVVCEKSYTNTMNIGEFPQGIYLLQIDTDEGAVMKKIIKI